LPLPIAGHLFIPSLTRAGASSNKGPSFFGGNTLSGDL
jgi:hypothetical protein